MPTVSGYDLQVILTNTITYQERAFSLLAITIKFHYISPF